MNLLSKHARFEYNSGYILPTTKRVLTWAVLPVPVMTVLINQPHPSIDKASIQTLVARFYGRAREDALIGPIFADAVHDWDHHIAQISEFWSAVILKTGGYEGRPMPPHLKLNLKSEHFDRWLGLFEQTAREIFPEEAAIIFIDRARRIADSFEMAIAAHAGKIIAPRHSRRIV